MFRQVPTLLKQYSFYQGVNLADFWSWVSKQDKNDLASIAPEIEGGLGIFRGLDVKPELFTKDSGNFRPMYFDDAKGICLDGLDSQPTGLSQLVDKLLPKYKQEKGIIDGSSAPVDVAHARVASSAGSFMGNPAVLFAGTALACIAGTVAYYYWTLPEKSVDSVMNPVDEVQPEQALVTENTQKTVESKEPVSFKDKAYALMDTTKQTLAKYNSKQKAFVASTLAGLGFGSYKLMKKPSLHDLVQKYIVKTQETDKSVILDHFSEALIKYGYTSEQDEKEALQYLEEAGII